jgi:hypothetical protein
MVSTRQRSGFFLTITRDSFDLIIDKYNKHTPACDDLKRLAAASSGSDIAQGFTKAEELKDYVDFACRPCWDSDEKNKGKSRDKDILTRNTGREKSARSKTPRSSRAQRAIAICHSMLRKAQI